MRQRISVIWRCGAGAGAGGAGARHAAPICDCARLLSSKDVLPAATAGTITRWVSVINATGEVHSSVFGQQHECIADTTNDLIVNVILDGGVGAGVGGDAAALAAPYLVTYRRANNDLDRLERAVATALPVRSNCTIFSVDIRHKKLHRTMSFNMSFAQLMQCGNEILCPSFVRCLLRNGAATCIADDDDDNEEKEDIWQIGDRRRCDDDNDYVITVLYSCGDFAAKTCVLHATNDEYIRVEKNDLRVAKIVI